MHSNVSSYADNNVLLDSDDSKFYPGRVRAVAFPNVRLVEEPDIPLRMNKDYTNENSLAASAQDASPKLKTKNSDGSENDSAL